MNIVKFKNVSHNNSYISEMWDKYFRDKWCYAVQLTTFFPIKDPKFDLPGLTVEQYMWLETNLQNALLNPEIALAYGIDLSTIPYLTGVQCYIDSKATKERNELDNLYVDNTLSNYSITIEDTKAFMVKSSTMLYNLYVKMSNQDSAILDMLSYYAGNKYNKTLSILEDVDYKLTNTSPGGGCGCTPTIVPQQTASISYKSNMKKIMIQNFSDIDFWMMWRVQYKEVLETMKMYLDSIKTNKLVPKMPSPQLNNIAQLNDCTSIATNSYNWFQDLDAIIEAFNLMINNDLSNRNFITMSLDKFTKYFENMMWVDYDKVIVDDSSRVDMSNYYTKEEIDFIISQLDFYTKNEVDYIIKNITIPDVDLTKYYTKEEVYTKQEVDSKISSIPGADLEGLATEKYVEDYVDSKIDDIDIPSTDGLATEDYVDSKIDEIILPDLDDYYNKEEINGKFEDIESDSISTKIKIETDGWIKAHGSIGSESGDITTNTGSISTTHGKIYMGDELVATEEYIDDKLRDLDISVDLDDYYKKPEVYNKSEVDEKIDELIIGDLDIDLSGYYKKDETYSKLEVDEKLLDIPTTDLTGYATESFVEDNFNNSIKDINLDGGEITF